MYFVRALVVSGWWSPLSHLGWHLLQICLHQVRPHRLVGFYERVSALPECFHAAQLPPLQFDNFSILAGNTMETRSQDKASEAECSPEGSASGMLLDSPPSAIRAKSLYSELCDQAVVAPPVARGAR